MNVHECISLVKSWWKENVSASCYIFIVCYVCSSHGHSSHGHNSSSSSSSRHHHRQSSSGRDGGGTSSSSSSSRSRQSTTSSRPPGDEVYVGKYKLVKTIGKGNFAKVKLAKHMPTGQEVCGYTYSTKVLLYIVYKITCITSSM